MPGYKPTPIAPRRSIGVSDMSTEVLSKTYVEHKRARKGDNVDGTGMIPAGAGLGAIYMYGMAMGPLADNINPTGIPLVDGAIHATVFGGIFIGAMLSACATDRLQHMFTQWTSMACAAHWHIYPSSMNEWSTRNSILLPDAHRALKPDSRSITAVKRELRARGIKPKSLLKKLEK